MTARTVHIGPNEWTRFKHLAKNGVPEGTVFVIHQNRGLLGLAQRVIGYFPDKRLEVKFTTSKILRDRPRVRSKREIRVRARNNRSSRK